MTTFILASLALAAIALAILTRPYWQRPPAPAPEPMTATPTAAPTTSTVDQLREQIRQLDSLHASGVLGAEAHASARAALEKKLVDQVVEVPAAAEPRPRAASAPAATAPAAPRAPLRTLAVFGVFFAAIAVGGYFLIGDPAAVGGGAAPAAAQGASGGDQKGHEIGPEQIAAMAERLAARLEKQPDDGEGWSMLARSYAVTGQHAKAVPAFRKAAALIKDDPVLLADFADALAMTQDRSIAGEPLKLVQKALEIDPANVKALSLAGTESFTRKDYKGALKYWEKLKEVAPPDSVFVQQVQGGIDEARSLAGLPPSPSAAPAPTAAAAPTASPLDAALGKSISGTVTLSAALVGKASPTDTVFVFARAVEGPRMPLAILRHQVKDLPIKFTLDDSLAMSPAMKLSAFPQVVVGARISKDGQAVPQPGDLQGLSPAVTVGSADVKIEINQTVSR